MPYQVNDIITPAFRKLGVVNELEAPTAAQSATALRILNDKLANEAADGLRLGWYPQSSITNTAPLRDADVYGVTMMLVKGIAAEYGIPIEKQELIDEINQSYRQLVKRYIQYFESDLGELQRPQAGPFGSGVYGI